MMPLKFAEQDDIVTISRIMGTDTPRQHLASMGFVPGAELRIVKKSAHDMIVDLLGSRMVLTESLLKLIMI